MRSLLTSLGIIIGTGSVIVMVAAGEGARFSIEERIASMGTNLIQIMPRRMGFRGGQGATPVRPGRLTRADEKKLRNEASYVLAVSGIVQRTFSVAAGDNSWSTLVMGVAPDYAVIRNWNMAEGIFFDENDAASRSTTAALGATVAENLFGGYAEAVGKRVRIGTNYFTVTGVLEKKGAGGGGNDQDDVILVPLDTALTRLVNSTNLNAIAMSVVNRDYMAAAQKEAELIFRESHKLSASADLDFEIMNQAEIIGMASETSRSLTVLLAAVAGVSLVVGGIGIMNIMLVSVTERTREIGIRMAVGARRGDILVQFLSESVILSLMGGITGIAIAFGVCRILELSGTPVRINPPVAAAAALFSAFVGIIFGYYPARKAAGLYPMDALRYE
jgi:putative ABC transport system permease protein